MLHINGSDPKIRVFDTNRRVGTGADRDGIEEYLAKDIANPIDKPQHFNIAKRSFFEESNAHLDGIKDI